MRWPGCHASLIERCSFHGADTGISRLVFSGGEGISGALQPDNLLSQRNMSGGQDSAVLSGFNFFTQRAFCKVVFVTRSQIRALMLETVGLLYRHFSIICSPPPPATPSSLLTIFSILSCYSVSPRQVSFPPFFLLILLPILFVFSISSLMSVLAQSPRLPIGAQRSGSV